MPVDPGKAQYQPASTSGYESRIALKKFDADVSPTVDADSIAGYSAGSLWYDSTAEKLYICTDADAGAAVWTEVNTGRKGGMLAYSTASATSDDGSEVIAYTYTLPADTLAVNGDTLRVRCAGTIGGEDGREARIYFDGNVFPWSTDGLFVFEADIVRTGTDSAQIVGTAAADVSSTQTVVSAISSGLDFTAGIDIDFAAWTEDSAGAVTVSFASIEFIPKF